MSIIICIIACSSLLGCADNRAQGNQAGMRGQESSMVIPSSTLSHQISKILEKIFSKSVANEFEDDFLRSYDLLANGGIEIVGKSRREQLSPDPTVIRNMLMSFETEAVEAEKTLTPEIRNFNNPFEDVDLVTMIFPAWCALIVNHARVDILTLSNFPNLARTMWTKFKSTEPTWTLSNARRLCSNVRHVPLDDPDCIQLGYSASVGYLISIVFLRFHMKDGQFDGDMFAHYRTITEAIFYLQAGYAHEK